MKRLSWRSKLTGSTGHGEYLNSDLAEAWLDHAGARWGHIVDHWLETMAQIECR